MPIYGRVVGREVRSNRDGLTEKLMLQVEISDPDDIQSVQLMNMAGEDTNPPDDAKVLVASIGPAFKVAFVTDDDIVPTMDIGERKMYSIDAGAIAAFINLLAGGDIELNGNADWAVAFTDLKTAFDQFVSDFNAHTHSGVTTGVGVSGAPVTPTAADMTGARVDNVRLP